MKYQEEFFKALMEGRVSLRKQHRGDVWQISVVPPRQDATRQQVPTGREYGEPISPAF